MSTLWGFIHRNWTTFSPPKAHKSPTALRFGILGAAKIGPDAIINPAKSHPDVIIQAVAARNKYKAQAYAKKHNIPQVFTSYEELLDDASIDAVYIPLPAGLHCEWALKAISRGKHVLLEKPATVNAEEAEMLFHSTLLQQPNAPLLLEAMHFRFQPVWQHFVNMIDQPNIQMAKAVARLPSYIVPEGGIRFDYGIGGGNMLDLGTYPMYALRQVMGADPEECTKCNMRTPPAYELCDDFAEAQFRFPDGRTGEIISELRAPIATLPTFKLVVLQREINIEDSQMVNGSTKGMKRKLTLNNFIASSFWHRIDVEDEFVVREAKSGHIVKNWTKRQSKKIYTFKECGKDQPGEPFWTSYRHQLEQFINHVRDKPGSGLWVEVEDSFAQARMIDMAYARSGLPLRPTKSFRLRDTEGS